MYDLNGYEFLETGAEAILHVGDADAVSPYIFSSAVFVCTHG